MPTPVTVARQCLTTEAAHALDEAVAVAKRRSHAQTTSLHAVSALLSLSPSTLRDACSRARNCAYSSRLQFKALDLCLSVSLDRVNPSGQTISDPPVSNSLMAAIKRSQAHQRRQPENYHLYHHTNPNQNPVSCVKVELQHLILSILDDPVVSRVFGEAGFRSTEIKLAVIRPIHQIIRYRDPPLFLCNLPEPGSDPCRFNFPFSTLAAVFHGDENSRRIGEVLKKEKGRNPLLMGVSAYDALKGFIEKRKASVLSKDLIGLTIESIETDISESSDEASIESRFEELSKIVDRESIPGLVINYGDLKVFVTEENDGVSQLASYVVTQLTRMLQVYKDKVWLMGSVSNHEIYLKFVKRFPFVERDWDLQILPISSPLRSCLSETYPKSSLMESFVPFGGFFSVPSEVKLPYTGLQTTEVSTKEKSVPKIKDDVLLLRAEMTGVKKKWDGICHSLHPTQPFQVLSFHPVKNNENFDKAKLGVKTSNFDVQSFSGSSLCSESQISLASSNSVVAGVELGIQDRQGNFNLNNAKSLFEAINEKVGSQTQASRIISTTICNRNMTKHRLDIWFHFVGPDRSGKKKMAVAIAEIMYGSKENFIGVNLNSGKINDYNSLVRGKTILDMVFEKLTKIPFSVLFLEHIDKADEQLQSSLSRAIQTGKFVDSYGREISFNNTIVVTTLESSNDKEMRVPVENNFKLDKNRLNLEITCTTRNPYFVNKRKSVGTDEVFEVGRSAEIAKRVHMSLDLNLPAEENEMIDLCVRNSEAWLEKFVNQDGVVNVIFEPVNNIIAYP